MINAILRFFAGLRFRLVMLSGFLFAIPWLGYEYVWEMEKYLRQGQERTLEGTVRAVATALHERPQLFDLQASFLPNVEKGRDLYAYHINQPIRLDGDLADWQAHRPNLHYYGNQSIIAPENLDQASLYFNHIVGKYDNFLYAHFEVFDDDVVYRHPNALRVDLNDYLQLSFSTPDGEFRRYLIATSEPGWLTPYLLDNANPGLSPLRPENRIQGAWKQTEQGYNIELRIPLDMLGSKLGFAITDVDKNAQTLSPKYITGATIGTSNVWDETQLGTVLVPSPEIERIIKGLGHSSSRIWVIDQHNRVLATAGELNNSNGVWGNLARRNEVNGDSWWSRFEKNYLHPLYYKILTRPPTQFIDELYDAAELTGKHIDDALAGQPGASWRLTPDNRAVILAAASPIYIDNKVMGAVIAEETTNGIRTLRNRALEKLFNNILAVMILGTLALFLFASRISYRIRKLRDQAEHAIDEHGRVKDSIQAVRTHDEIGDLSRSFASVVNRLGQYNNYLESMSSRLSHELRTPVAVVRSSLEMLSMQQLDKDANVYMERAQQGLARLTTILTQMSEATRLEHSLQSSDKDTFDLGAVVASCMQGYQLAYPQQKFELSIQSGQLQINGVADFIAQLLDKLIANAVEFSNDDCSIDVSLHQLNHSAILQVSNTGPCLPAEMHNQLFNSMVSVRAQDKQQQPHLGLGLHIAKLITDFHKGSIEVENKRDETGVIVTVIFPLQ